MAPDVVFLDLSTILDVMPELFRQVKAAPSCPEIIAMYRNADPQIILGAMRAGSREFLYPPLSPNLEESLDRISSERQQRRESASPGGKTVGFLAAKGGCGATTLACHASLEFARQTSRETLLMDLDLSAGIVRLLMKSKSRYSVMDALNNVHRLDVSYWKALVTNGRPDLEVIGAPKDGYPREIPSWPNIRHVLRFARSQYGWTLVDLGRGTSSQLFGALDELDELVLVTSVDVPSMHQVSQVVDCLTQRDYPRSRIHLVINRATRRSEVRFDDVEKIVGLPVFGVIPNDYQALSKAYSGGELLTGGPVKSAIAVLVSKLAGVPEPPRKSKFSLFG
jgi:pilus assembly protein CpaE